MRLLPLKAFEFRSYPVLTRHAAIFIPCTASNWEAWSVLADSEEANLGVKIGVVFELDKVVLGLEYANPRAEDGAVANFGDLLNDLGSRRGPGHQDLKSGNRGIVEFVTL